MSSLPLSHFDTREVVVGIICGITTIIAGSILQSTRQINIHKYFASQYTWRDKPKSTLRATAFAYYLIMLIPIAFFIAWVVLLAVNHGVYPTIPVALIGIFIIILFVPSHGFYFYLKVLMMVIVFLAAKISALGLKFVRNDPVSFFSLTTVSLTINALFSTMCIWLLNSSSWTIPEDCPSFLKQQMVQQLSVWEKQEEPPKLITGGLYTKIVNLPKRIKNLLIIVLYLIGLLTLTAYSLIGYYLSAYNFQATVNSIAVLTTDIISFILIFDSKKAGFNPIFNAVGIIIVRVLIIGFTGDLWYFGYCIVFLVLVGKIQRLIINKYYPAIEEIPVNKRQQINLLTSPQFALFFLVGMFVGLTIFLANDNQKHVITDSMPFGAAQLKFWVIGTVMITKSASQFFHLISVNIVLRQVYNLQIKRHCYLGCRLCGEYYVFLFLSYICLLAVAFLLFAQIGGNIIWLSALFLPIYYQSNIIFLTNWKDNNYQFLGDVQNYNKKLQTKRKKLEKMKKIKQEIGEKLRQNVDGNQEGSLLLDKKDSTIFKLIRNQSHEQNAVTNIDKALSEIQPDYENWKDKMSFWSAFKSKKLLPTDYRIIGSLIGIFVTLAVYSIVFYFTTGQKDVTAFAIVAFILTLLLCRTPVQKYFETFEPINAAQVISFLLGLVINYSFGIVSYVFEWNRAPVYTAFWGAIIPFLIAAQITFKLLRDVGICLTTYISTAIASSIGFIIGIILLVAFDEIATGIIFMGIAFLFTYIIFCYYIYLFRDKSMPKILILISVILIVVGIFSVMIYGFISPDFDDFYGFSITYLVINFLLIMAGFTRLSNDLYNADERPNYFSPFGMPIFKYNPQIKSAVLNQQPFLLWIAGWIMFYIYTLLMMIFLDNIHYGISTSMLFLAFMTLTFIYFTTYNVYQAFALKKQLNDSLLTRAWQEMKEYRKNTLLRWFTDHGEAKRNLQNFQNIMRVSSQKKSESRQNLPTSSMTLNKQSLQLQNKPSNIIQIENKQLSSQQLESIESALQSRLKITSQNQFIILINFWVRVKILCKILKKQKMLTMINFIRDSQDLLIQGGIVLILQESIYSLDTLYQHVLYEIYLLSGPQREFFFEQLQKYKKYQIKDFQKRERIALENVEKQEIRDKKLMKHFENTSYQEREKSLGSLKRWEQLSKSRISLFTDDVFNASNKNLPASAIRFCEGWSRPSKDSVTFNNDSSTKIIKSNYLNNAHIINAISMLSKSRLPSIIIGENSTVPGAYMIKLYKKSKEIYIIIDDNFPVSKQSEKNSWIMGQCDNKNEIFCNIIEKAYAKLYGGYQNLENGDIKEVMNELTFGYTEQILMKQYRQLEISQFYNKLQKLKKENAIMFVHCPALYDGEISVNGIQLSYTYLIVDVQKIDNNQLIKLQKPCCQIQIDNNKDQKQGQERKSNLNWDQKSLKWSKRLKALTKYNDPEQRKKYMWMEIQDLLYCFRSLYVTHLFDSSWSKLGPYHGEWNGHHFRKIKNFQQDFKFLNFLKFPQYGIVVSKKCSVVISLTQNQQKDGEGLNKIYFIVESNDGERIEQPEISKLVGMSGIAVNDKKISKQIQLKASTYPYTFTLLVGIMENVQSNNTGSYDLSIHCNCGKNWSVIQNL